MCVGLRHEWARRFGARGRPSVARPAARRHTNGIGRQPIHSHECVCVHPAASSVSSYSEVGPSAVPGPGQLLAVRCPRTGQTSEYRSATLLLWVLSGLVLKHGPRSLACARVIGMHKPKGEMKVKVGLRADRGRMGRVTMRPRTPGASRSHCEKRRT